jgi:selenocysteine lyase/cysteine desulfurase
MKFSDHFSSMDEVKNWLERMKPYCTPEQYEAFKFVMGLGEQEGEYIEIEGIGKIDKTIASFVQELNQMGFHTLASCSGILEEHPQQTERISGYLSFLFDKEQSKIVKQFAKELGLIYQEGECYLKPAFTIRIKGETDEEIRNKWRQLNEKFKSIKGNEMFNQN